MASTRQLKSRIRSVKSTKQITKAMQMVAASKMRRAQDATKASTPYFQAASDVLTFLAGQGATNEHPLFQRREVKTRLIVFIAADKGLAGAYNSNVSKKYLELLKRDEERGIKNLTITVGRKASALVARLKNVEVIGSYDDVPDHPSGVAFYTTLNMITGMFENGEVDVVTVVYTNFVNSVIQEATWMRLLPAGTEVMSNPAKVPNSVKDAAFEPSIAEVLDAVAYRLVGARLFQAHLDSQASEHVMRMVAMKNATDNAGDLIEDLTLEMNKARQAAITQELSEISAGVEAMK